MNNKKLKIIGITVLIIIFVLLIPKIEGLNDGGTKIYKSLIYEIIKVHKIKDDPLEGYYEGTVIKIFGKEVYNNVPKGVIIFVEGNKNNTSFDYVRNLYFYFL